MKRLTVALMGTALTLLLAPGAALGLPQDPNAHAVTQYCDGSAVAIVFIHPGAGTALWDITTADVTSGPNHLIKEVSGEVFKNDVLIGTFLRSFGNKTGQGEPIRCVFTENFTFPDGAAGRVEAVSFHTLK
jgi:hypothetical protein